MTTELPVKPSNNHKSTSQTETSRQLLLLCDFTGKIVFWKGDPKVLQTAFSNYLHRNFLSFDFTLHSRLLLASQLTAEIFKVNKKINFQLELVRKSSGLSRQFSKKIIRSAPRSCKNYFWSQIKVLKVAASCVKAQFKSCVDLSYGCCQVEEESHEEQKKDFHTFELKAGKQDKFLMFQIEELDKEKQKTRPELNLSIEEVQIKILDLEYILRKRQINSGPRTINQQAQFIKQSSQLHNKRDPTEQDELKSLLDDPNFNFGTFSKHWHKPQQRGVSSQKKVTKTEGRGVEQKDCDGYEERV